MMILSRNAVSSLPLFIGTSVTFFLYGCMIATTTRTTTLCNALEDYDYGKKPKQTKVIRENNLDHWDSDTLAYYLDEYPGYDLAVMFYAPWDDYSNQLAPYWNQIAHILDAGTTQSKLIMSLFDCELNSAHMELCKALSVTHYPTLLFIGSGPFHDTDPITKVLFGKKKSAGLMGESPVPNTIKFQGNWQYYDSILDWVKTMQALSRWHTWSTKGFGKRLRNLFLRTKIQNEQLPLGVPIKTRAAIGSSSKRSVTTGSDSSNSAAAASASAAAGSITSSTNNNESIEYLEKQVTRWKDNTDKVTKIAVRTATMLDSVLFGDKNSTDMFTLLNERDAWKDMKSVININDIYRFCVMEVTLDYCDRVSDTLGTKVVDKLLASDLSSDELSYAADNMGTLIKDELKKQEPYCSIFDDCITNDMKDESCRPKICPFINENACRYTTSCMDPSVVDEYADALKLDLDTPVKSSSPSAKKVEDETTTATKENKKRGWGSF